MGDRKIDICERVRTKISFIFAVLTLALNGIV